MSKRPIVLAVGLLAAAAAAQQSPFQSPMIDAGDYAWSTVAGDLDADGDEDLVINNNSQVWLMEQVAPGAFGPASYQAVVLYIDRMALADFDHDGDLDLGASVDVGGSQNQDKAAMLEGLGLSFGLPVLMDTAQDPTDIVAGDFNEDGNVDLALPCSAKSLGSTGTRVSLFRGVGDGSFLPTLDVLGGSGPRGVDSGDLNLDGNLDIAVVNLAGTLRSMLGNGNAGFALQAGITLSNNAADVTLGNVTTNGVPDALVLFEAPWYGMALGLGDGTWQAKPLSSMPAYASRGALADVDEDGDDDVVVLQVPPTNNPGARGFAVVMGYGNGAFDPPVRYGSAEDPHDIVVRDLTQDGDLDVFLGVPDSSEIGNGLLMPGDGEGRFSGTLRTGDRPTELALTDLDLDGNPEMLVCCAWGGVVTVHPGLGHGLFGPELTYPFGVNCEGLVGADLIEDGLPDVLVANAGNPGGLTLRAGNGTLVLGPIIAMQPGDNPWGMGSGDANLDGHIDLVLACLGGTARVMLGDGAGNFTFSDEVATASISPDAATFGDLDADGLPDLVATTNGGFGVTVALGEGGGLFADPVQVPITNYNQHDVALGDLDGDDDLDIVSAGGFVGGLNVLENDGRAGFSPGPALSAPDTWGVAIADVNADGRADVIAGAESYPGNVDFGGVVAWLGAEHGTFAAPITAIGPAKTEELLVADLNGDGAPDAAALAVDHDQVWLYPNRNGPWEPLGKGLAGIQGKPRQQGFGSLVPGAPFEFLLTDARPLGTTWHVVGLSAINVPFKGGTLVPSPTLVTGPWPLDPAGELSLQGPWPGAPSGLSLWFQFLTSDPAAPKGWSLSDALRATMP